jgi:hypothetical protein
MADAKTITLNKAVLIGLAALIIGLMLGPRVDRALFGYDSVEECILDGHSAMFAAQACATLYPDHKDR